MIVELSIDGRRVDANTWVMLPDEVHAFGGGDDADQTDVAGPGLHQVVEREDTPAIRGMVHKIRHLVEVTS